MSSNTAGRITAIIAHQGDVPINRLNSVIESLMQVFDERIAKLEEQADKQFNLGFMSGNQSGMEQTINNLPVKRLYEILGNLNIHYETQTTIVNAFCEAIRKETC